MIGRIGRTLVLVALCLSGSSVAQDTPKPAPVEPAKKSADYAGITWEADYEEAFAKARRLDRPIMFGVMMDGEKGCLTMLAKVYTDPRVIKKSREFVNLPCCPDELPPKTYRIGGKDVPSHPFFPGVSSRACRLIEERMRAAYQKSDKVIAPQHVFVKPDGTLLFRKEYWLTVDQMIAEMDRALRKHKGLPEPEKKEEEKKEDKKADDAPAVIDEKVKAKVERLLATISAAPLEEKEKATKELLGIRWDEANQRLVTALLEKKVKGKKNRFAIIRAAGAPEFAGAAKAFVELLALKDVLLRNAVVVTLEEMTSRQVAGDLLAHFKKERDKQIKTDVIRALGPCGDGDKAAREFLLKEFESKKQTHRVAAAMALGHHVAGAEDVFPAIEKRWKKEASKGKVKPAILWGLLMSQEKDLAPKIEDMVEKERNGQVKQAGVAVAALLSGSMPRFGGRGRRGGGGQGGLLRLYNYFTPLFAKDRVERKLRDQLAERFRRGRENRGRRGRGGNRDSGDDKDR